jgi:hypothetical protein
LRICFFAGPSLTASEIRAACATVRADICVLPPIQQGDLLRCIRDLPDIVGIIDGYFYQVPAVQHKEILLALKRGTRVLGAASLGALRAAELDSFGMLGIGQIYRWYKQRYIDGDDEVAVAHAGQEEHFRPLTEPVVNIRHHLQMAQARGIISAETAAALLTRAKRLHFTERTYHAVLQQAHRSIAKTDELAAFRRFLQQDAVDLKREDALALVRTVTSWVQGKKPQPPPASFAFHKTKLFRILERDYVGHACRGRHIPEAVVLSFQKLLSPSFPDLCRQVTLRCLAADEALHRGLCADEPAGLLARFRGSNGLESDAEYLGWLHAHYLAEQELVCSLRDRDLETRLLALFGMPSDGTGDNAEWYGRLGIAVASRMGVSEEDLSQPLFMQPGILWEEPFIREIKWRGDFPRALDLASRILEFEAAFFEGKPELKLTFDALLFQAADRVESWLAGYWGITLDKLESTLRKRGFVRYRDFLETARLAYIYALHGPKPVLA